MPVNPSKVIFFDHQLHTEHIFYSHTYRKHHFWQHKKSKTCLYYIYFVHVCITSIYYIYLFLRLCSARRGLSGVFFCGNTFLNITFGHRIQNLRKISLRSASIAPLEVLCASSYGSSKVEIENYVLIMTFWYQIQNLCNISFRCAPIAPPEVLCASSYGSSKVKLEFWSQCKVLQFCT